MNRTQGEDELRIRRILQQRGVGPDAVAPQPDADAVTAAAATTRGRASAQPQPTHASATAAEGDWWDALYADEQPDRSPREEMAAQPQPHPRGLRSRIPDWWSGQHIDLTEPYEPDPEEEEDSPATDQAAAEDDDETAEDAAQEPQDSDAQPQDRRSRIRLHKLSAKRSHPTAPAAPTDAARALVDSPQPRRSLLDAYDNIPPRIRWLILHGTAAAAGYRIGWVQHSTRTAAWIADHNPAHPSALFWYGCAFGCELLRRRLSHHILVVRWAAAIPIASIVTGTALYGTGWHDLELPL
ncbi:hypothetical protein ACFZB5_13650 [Streptomyces nodosus]|uniref:hypothetical protein n=1 Tax=Streptomyces nodosus TaxID=40318 RepID=UPI0036E100E3